MKNWHIFLVLFCTTGLFSCASQPDKKPDIDEFFEADIKPNGLKLFTYKVNVNMPTSKRSKRGMRGTGGKGGRMGREGGHKPNLEAITNKQKEAFYAQLDAQIAKTGFCREGYTAINSYFERGRSEIHGECNEGATEDDREKFTSNKDITISKTPEKFGDKIFVPDNSK